MKIKILFCVMCMIFLPAHRSECNEAERRCLFVSVIQDPPVLSSRVDIEKLIDFAKSARINKLFVQIYFSGRAWFPSDIADSAPYRSSLESVSHDPFALLIEKAHAAGIEVHAWMNMLSLGANGEAKILKKYGAGILTRNLKLKKSLKDYKIDSQFFLEPGDLRVRNYLSKLVGEVLRAYPGLDGIQFDYIRYPDKEPFYGYNKMNIERYKSSTGNRSIDEASPAWKDWKRRQVTDVLEILINSSRAIRPDIKISATGCMPYSRAYLEAYQDWPYWIARGMVEYVTVMSYSPDPVEFKRTLAGAREKTDDFKRVNIAIGAYRLVESPKVFKEEFHISESSGAGGFAIFHYGSLLENQLLVEPLTENSK